MPNLDQHGPMGQGPMTGRKMGRCTNYGAIPKKQNDAQRLSNDDPGDARETAGRGIGFRRIAAEWGTCKGVGKGFGIGRQNRFRGGC